jgi:hypothetical protein
MEFKNQLSANLREQKKLEESLAAKEMSLLSITASLSLTQASTLNKELLALLEKNRKEAVENRDMHLKRAKDDQIDTKIVLERILEHIDARSLKLEVNGRSELQSLEAAQKEIDDLKKLLSPALT